MKRHIYTILAIGTLATCSAPAADAGSSAEANTLDAVRHEHEALRVHLDTLEAVCYKWTAKAALAAARDDEVKGVRRRIEQLQDLHRIAYAAYLEHVASSGAPETNNTAFLFLRQEVDRTAEAVRDVEDDAVEYRRLDGLVRYVPGERDLNNEIIATLERRRMEVATRLMILETEYPKLTNASPAVVAEVRKLNAETLDALRRGARN